MVCFRCEKRIEKEDDYYIITEMRKSKSIRKDYVHKKCWDKFIGQLDGASSSLKKSNFLLNAMAKQMNKMGMIPDKEVII